ncbi:MAG: Gfo/Idh/MocA family oxidoreductase [Gemmataceae bacterium]
MSARLNRRRFLQASSAAGLGYLFTGPAASVSKAFGANDKLRVAGIGIGGKGSSDIDQAGNLMDVVALCDIDDKFMAPKAKKWPSAKTFADYRKLLDTMAKEIDAAVVSTPDHHHAPAALRAMMLGKHVYVQKPLTHTVHEARILRETAAKMKLCTQMGNQGTTEDGLRKAVEFVQAGGIGKVTEAHIWTNRPVWSQAPEVIKRPPEKPVPAHVHWEEFIGPAPMRPYAEYPPGTPRTYGGRKGAYHDFHWRGWQDFGTGALGDMACHTANMAYMALKLGFPTSVIAESAEFADGQETYPSWAHVTIQFPERDGLAPLTWHWYEGKKPDGKYVLPAEEKMPGAKKRGENDYAFYFKDGLWKFYNPKAKNKESTISSGSFLVGEKGVVFSPNDYGADVYVVTDGGVTKLTGKPEKLPSNNGGDQGQKTEWVKAIKEGKPTLALANFDYAGMLTETVLLGNIAIKLAGQKLDWDGPGLKFTNSDKATALVTKQYRKGWELMAGTTNTSTER